MSGEDRYPGWCCRQIAAQLSQALFTMADLHAQVSDLREENRQLKMKNDSFDSRRLQKDAVSPLNHEESFTSSLPVSPEKPLRAEKVSEEKISHLQHLLNSKQQHESDQDQTQRHFPSNSPSIPERVVLNVPYKHSEKDCIDSLQPTSRGDLKCDKCESSFPNPDMLTIHQAVHMGRSFHVCKICNAMFLLKADLYRHWASHPNVKQHPCQLCGKAYTSKNNYKLHIKTHTGVGLYPCEVCGKAFHSENHLNVHRRIHTGERPFVCQYCDKSFTQKSGLINHTRLHTGEKPFLCPSCPKAFTQKSNLNFHLTKHHPVHDPVVP